MFVDNQLKRSAKTAMTLLMFVGLSDASIDNFRTGSNFRRLCNTTWVFVPLEASLKLFDLLLFYSDLTTKKSVLKLFDYELLAEMRTVLGADRGIYRFQRSANPQRHTWFTTESHCTPDRTALVRSVCKPFQLLL